MSTFEIPPISDSLTLQLTPRGHLVLVPDADAFVLSANIRRQLEDAFAVGAGNGLFYLGSTQVGTVLPPALAWWRDFAARYVTAVCGLSACVPSPLLARPCPA